MFTNKIDIRHLRYFVATVQHGSIRGASQELNLSQPPLTRQIQYLEEVLGVQLLLRKRHGVEPTDAGRALFTEAVNILNLVEQACATTQLIGQGALGRLDVGVFGSAVLDIVPRIVLEFRQRFPNVEVVLHNMDRETQVKALQERRISVGFNRFFLEYPGLQWEQVVHERMIIAMPSSHRLAQREAISLSDLAGEPMILYPRTNQPTGFSNFLLRAFHEINIEPRIVQMVDDVVTAVAFVSSGVGLTPAVDSARSLQLPDVVYVPLVQDDGPAAFDLCMIYRSNDTSPLIEGFRQAVKTVTT